jgi:flagellar hook-basal body complex protein FliE
MSGFDLPSLPGFDPTQLQSALEQFGKQGERAPATPGVQDPERFGARLPGGSRTSGHGSAFEGMLADSIAQVQALQQDVQTKTRGLALGEGVELHDVLIASSKSEVAFNLLLEVRNKLVDAWEKLSRSAT